MKLLTPTENTTPSAFIDLAEHLSKASRLLEKLYPASMDLSVNVSYDIVWIETPDGGVSVNGSEDEGRLRDFLAFTLYEMSRDQEA